MRKKPLEKPPQKPRRLLESWESAWTPEVETVMLYTVAKALGRNPHALPPMSSEMLWQSYKQASQLVKLPEDLARTLTLGENMAFDYGVVFQSPTFPVGETLGEILSQSLGCSEDYLRKRFRDHAAEIDQAARDFFQTVGG